LCATEFAPEARLNFKAVLERLGATAARAIAGVADGRAGLQGRRSANHVGLAKFIFFQSITLHEQARARARVCNVSIIVD
jgi:hypothetical protein